jgi:hypothetical protein
MTRLRSCLELLLVVSMGVAACATHRATIRFASEEISAFELVGFADRVADRFHLAKGVVTGTIVEGRWRSIAYYSGRFREGYIYVSYFIGVKRPEVLVVVYDYDHPYESELLRRLIKAVREEVEGAFPGVEVEVEHETIRAFPP